MKRLVFDTSTDSVWTGVFSDSKWIQTKVLNCGPGQQSKVLFQCVVDLLAESALEFSHIDQIAVGKGPGSYTGLRMGMTAAKIWSEFLNCPLYSFDSSLLWNKGTLTDDDFVRVLDSVKFSPVYVNDHFAETK